MLSITVLFAANTFITAVKKERVIDSIAKSSAARLEALQTPVNFFESTDHWKHIVDLIDATLDVTRLILLSHPNGNKRLDEIFTLRCTVDDIKERRRDSLRIPFSTAISSEKPLRLVAPFFSDPQPNEEEYMVPLRYGDELLGFWVFGITRDKLVQIPLFTTCIQDYADEISELLFQHKEWQRATATSRLDRWLRLDPKREPHHRARHAIAALGSRLKMFEDLLNTMATATAVFDLFGRYIAGNQPLQRLLKNAGVDGTNVELLSIMTQIANVPIDEVKRSLRYVILQRGVISVVTSLTNEQGATLTLHIRPLTHDPDDHLGEAEPAPFQLRGIILELIDVTQLRRIYQLKEELVEKLNTELKVNLQGMHNATQLLGNQKVPATHRHRLLGLTTNRLSDAVNVLEEAQRYLQLNLHGARLDCYPIDVRPVLSRALDLAKITAANRGVGFRADLDALGHELVFADPQSLQDLISLILNFLIFRAEPETTVNLHAKQDSISVIQRHEVVFWFTNDCKEITEETLRSRLSDETANSNDEFYQLCNAMSLTQTWGGSLSVETEDSRHLIVKLALKGFI